jgi:uncharacterized membrane protein
MTDLPEENGKRIIPKIPLPVQKRLEELVPDKGKREQLRQIYFEIQSHAGPLPQPEALAKYENVLPGLAERIVRMAENQSSHRIKLEDVTVNSQLGESKRGQLFGLIVGIFALMVALALGLSGQGIAASFIGSFDIVGLVAVFVTGRRQHYRNLAKKAGN